MITILYFAKLKEQLGLDQEIIENNPQSTSELKQVLINRGGVWKDVISDKSIQIAINQTLSSWQADIPQNAEIAIFPPITGG